MQHSAATIRPCKQQNRGCHSHRLYSHSCDRTQSTVKPSEQVQSTFKSQCGTDQISVAIRSEPGSEWGYTCAERLFPNIQARGLGLQFKYPDFFAGKISEQSKVNSQKLAWSTVKLPKEPVKVLTRGRSCDYRVYGSDTPLAKCRPFALQGYQVLHDSSK